MTKSKWMTILGATACGLILSISVVAQQGAATQTATQPRFTQSSVALVDVGHIISQNASIDTKMAEINEKYAKLLQDSMKDRQELTQMREKLSTYDRNSDIYRETEQQMLSRAGELESKQLMLIKQATEERLQLFNSVYTTVMNYSQAMASRFGMSIVLNYDRTNLLEQVPLLPNPQQYEAFFSQYAQTVASRPVVWANKKTVDLTALVLNEIQKADPSTIRKANTTVKAQAARTNTAVGTQATAPAVAPATR
ncbi:MAG: OmpH family outer membrane protein [Planctomycetia bacterium]|nr:OmpH family outer membrane protein [Planctomycetia bacterium]